MTKRLKLLAAGAALALTAPAVALAQTAPAIDLSEVTDQQAAITTAIGTIGGVIVAIYVAVLGFRMAPWALSKVSALFRVKGG